ncbi:MAG TPA: dTDP-4-dehydrorhamnose 3,5-epimerase family protein [Anaerolineae bacterium]|nr:dTDP-4-dehydrorhamnose 3,5-epimerase family protein [Anaerolineae bacterium]
MSIEPKQDVQTVSFDGEPIQRMIHGVVIRPAVTQIDDRGTLCEILRPDWDFHPAPLTYVYQFTIRPGMIKGWHVHHQHDDRIFISQGTVKVVLYDDRPDSPTYKTINVIVRSDLQRSIMIIPSHVYHAHQNIGSTDALMISMPTRLYDHESPDVYRYPIDNDYIPYQFIDVRGY